jgi:hypothetical protein
MVMSGMRAKRRSPVHNNSLSDQTAKVSRQRLSGFVGGTGENLHLMELVARIDKFISAGTNRFGQREDVSGLGRIAFANSS